MGTFMGTNNLVMLLIFLLLSSFSSPILTFCAAVCHFLGKITNQPIAPAALTKTNHNVLIWISEGSARIL